MQTIKWKGQILLTFLLLFAVATVVMLYFFWEPMKTFTYELNDRKILNPERGFYVQFDSAHTEDSDVYKMSELRKHGMTITLIGFDIKDFVNTPISDAKLAELDNVLYRARNLGLKVIFRAAYGYTSASRNYDPKDIAQVKAHIQQIAPIINRYKDIVFVVQAGFLGAWGEWHSSNLLTGNNAADTFIRNQILLTLLEQLDPSIPVDLRRPRFIRDAIAAGFDVGRLGLHNDALLSTADDMGTYDDPIFDREGELAWANQILLSGVNGGEMPLLGPFSQVENAMNELNQLHISYLNHEYNKEVLAYWKTQKFDTGTALSYIDRHLGYRLGITSVTVPEKMKANESMHFKVTMLNAGFAAPSAHYVLEAVILHEGATTYFPIQDVNASALRSNQLVTINAQVKFPNDLAGSPVKIGLRIRPVQESIKDNPAYCIELSNKTTSFVNGTNFFCVYTNKNHIYSAASY